MSVTPLLVLGMHRSGTSALAGALVRLGGQAPANLMQPTVHNERGFWESTVVMALNDEILASNGNAWDDWRRFDPGWYDSPALGDFRARATATVADEFGDAALPVVKDPRMCRLMPFWSSVFRELHWSSRVLLPVRSPLEVARSLQQRDGMSLNRACLLWLRHVLEAEAESRGTPRAVIDWNGMLSDWRRALARAAEQMGIDLPGRADSGLLEVDEFLSSDLRHQHATSEELRLHPAINDWMRVAYAALLRLVEDPACKGARRTLDDVRARFDAAALVFGGVLQEEEQAWRDKLARSEQDGKHQVADNDQVWSEQLARKEQDWREKLAISEQDWEHKLAENDWSWREKLVLSEQDREHKLAENDWSWREKLVLSEQDRERKLAESERVWLERFALKEQDWERKLAENERVWRERLALSEQDWERKLAEDEEVWRERLAIRETELEEAEKKAAEYAAQLDKMKSLFFWKVHEFFYSVSQVGPRLLRLASRHENQEYGQPRAIHSANGDFADTLQEPEKSKTLDEIKCEVRQSHQSAFKSFIGSDQRLVIPASDSPRVSVIIVVYNQAELTYQCLSSLAATTNVSIETIVIDNASSDWTKELFARVDGVRYVQNSENKHFVRAINQAAELARGDILLLLNNDARLQPGALSFAVEDLDKDPTLGAVGGRVVLPDGTVQEAGSIVWSDGSCLGYGRGRNPHEPEFQFRREVDYCSGAFLAIRRNLFERLGRLDVRFAPAYYEETDFCLVLQDAGYRVLYDPRIEILHFEFGSSASSEAAVTLQVRNKATFVEKHRSRLSKTHLSHGSSSLVARMRPSPGGRVLLIDDCVPDPSLGSGFPRSHKILWCFQQAGCFVTFYPMTFPEVDMEAAYKVVDGATEIASGLGGAGLVRFLNERKSYYDAVVVSRPHNMRMFKEGLSQVPGFLAGTLLIYDAEAIFALRDAALADLRRRPLKSSAITAAVEEELGLAKGASTIVSVSEREATYFRNAGFDDVRVISHAVPLRLSIAAFSERRDILFVGAIRQESPNEDSVLWFVTEVMPRLDALMGTDWGFLIAGLCESSRVQRCANARIKVLGRLNDLSPFYNSARIFVAPTRFAAGVPHKIHESASFGLPVVATHLLIDQLGWTNGEDILGASDADSFAASCGCLYTDEDLWDRLRNGAAERIRQECDPGDFARRTAALLSNRSNGRMTAVNPEALSR